MFRWCWCYWLRIHILRTTALEVLLSEHSCLPHPRHNSYVELSKDDGISREGNIGGQWGHECGELINEIGALIKETPESHSTWWGYEKAVAWKGRPTGVWPQAPRSWAYSLQNHEQRIVTVYQPPSLVFY